MSNKKVQLKDKDGNNIYPQLVKQCILDVVYPVGSIYLSSENTNPATLFGGTWVQIAQGKTLVGVDTSDSDFNTAQKTGGNKTHNHLMPIGFGSEGYFYGLLNNGEPAFGSTVVGNITRIANNGTVSNNSPVRIGFTQNASNVQPYFTCYIWKRTA